MPVEITDCAALLLGLACAGIGGELSVRGIVGIAEWLRISPGIIGATVAAFATSSPELAVAIASAAQGVPQLSLGDVLGSNVINVALVLGTALLFSPICVPRGSVRRNYALALIVPGLTGVLAWDGVISHLDGACLLLLFFAWLTSVTLEARRERSAAAAVAAEHRHGIALLLSALGLALLYASGRLIVAGAHAIAAAFGIGEFVIGATVVAIGTSMPELATTVIAHLRGHHAVGLGTVLGSNIFNGLFIVAIAALITPIAIAPASTATALVFGIAAVALALPSPPGRIERSRGVLLLALYCVYSVLVLQRGE